MIGRNLVWMYKVDLFWFVRYCIVYWIQFYRYEVITLYRCCCSWVGKSAKEQRKAVMHELRVQPIMSVCLDPIICVGVWLLHLARWALMAYGLDLHIGYLWVWRARLIASWCRLLDWYVFKVKSCSKASQWYLAEYHLPYRIHLWCLTVCSSLICLVCLEKYKMEN